MKARKVIVGLLAAVGAVSLFCAWDFVGMSVSGLNVESGTFKIGGTAVTSTAAELNILDGATVTATELNLLSGQTTLGTGTNALAPAYIWVGSATSNQAAVAVSGDISLATNGAVSIATGTLTTNVIVDASYTNTIVLRALASGTIVVESWTQDAVK